MFDHFSFLAPFYEKFIRPKGPEDLWRLADLPTAGALLDAGGGTGRVAQHMLGKASQVIVADLSFEMLLQAKGKPGLRTLCSHSENLPFPEGYFDCVIMVDALHHVCDQTQTIGELWRVLKPGGRLVIEEPDVRVGMVKLIALAEKLALMRSHFLTPPEIAALFDRYQANTHIARDGYISWVVVEKPKHG